MVVSKVDNRGKLLDMYKNVDTFSRVGDNYETLGDKVYDIIKNKIIYREINPGERIYDQEIANELGVSRSLVRQAFTILENEELITSIPRSGFYVKKLYKEDVKEIFEIRTVLEKTATEKAVPRLTDDQIQEVRDLFDDAWESIKEGDLKVFIQADQALHRLLVDNCGNDRLKKMINKYQNYYVFYRIIDVTEVERAKMSFQEHNRILKAVEEGNKEKAAEKMVEHLDYTIKNIIMNFDEFTYGG